MLLNNNAVFLQIQMNFSTYKFFHKALGIKFIFLVSIGSSKFSVAGKILLFNATIENIDSTPTAPSKCPEDLLN